MDILTSVVEFATQPEKILVVVLSVMLSIALLQAWKKYNKPALLYAHLLFLLSPLFYFALSVNCSMGMAQGLIEWCTTMITKFIIYLLPPLIVISFIVGYALLPRLYSRIAKPLPLKSFKALCTSTGIGAQLFLIDKAKPTAFTFGKKIFLSVGMCELLSKRELEAVLLHELYHIHSRASWGKFSVGFVKLFSPIARFSASSVECEEKCADEFAETMQKTSRFINTAKKKVSLS